ncbi:mobilization protein [Aeromonas sp. Y293-4]|jgi:Na+-translocating ferredoxin:NAD+ oxidoreductase RNF subunit RnfB|uniref:mobilization protein n=1 Tax=Aeromonas sp. Y293-4 TaxID=2990504 RepID=UPI0022E6EDB1|nr:mobilization protein [Aeromonas sp. Y293-4]
MTELERILLDRLEQIETAHRQQTAALEQQLQQQAHSLSELQTACTSALASCGTLCSELQRSFETLQSGVERSNRATTTAFGSLNNSVNDLSKALDALQRAQR